MIDKWKLGEFLRESLMIEGMNRYPTDAEITSTSRFLGLQRLTVADMVQLNEVYAPGKSLRDSSGMDVQVGSHVPPRGGPYIFEGLRTLLNEANGGHVDAWQLHVRFLHLHPFMDGNGRTGRALWLWKMTEAPAIGFLHKFYYQTLEHHDRDGH